MLVAAWLNADLASSGSFILVAPTFNKVVVMNKGLVVHISLTADEKEKFYKAVDASDFNKSVFAKKALMASVYKSGRKMFKPADINKGMLSTKNE